MIKFSLSNTSTSLTSSITNFHRKKKEQIHFNVEKGSVRREWSRRSVITTQKTRRRERVNLRARRFILIWGRKSTRPAWASYLVRVAAAGPVFMWWPPGARDAGILEIETLRSRFLLCIIGASAVIRWIGIAIWSWVGCDWDVVVLKVRWALGIEVTR